jgi:hypothetical protein
LFIRKKSQLLQNISKNALDRSPDHSINSDWSIFDHFILSLPLIVVQSDLSSVANGIEQFDPFHTPFLEDVNRRDSQ